jgi:hypothetical protein
METSSTGKSLQTFRLDNDVLDWLRSFGKGWHSRVNDQLRAWMEKDYENRSAKRGTQNRSEVVTTKPNSEVVTTRPKPAVTTRLVTTTTKPKSAPAAVPEEKPAPYKRALHNPIDDMMHRAWLEARKREKAGNQAPVAPAKPKPPLRPPPVGAVARSFQTGRHHKIWDPWKSPDQEFSPDE